MSKGDFIPLYKEWSDSRLLEEYRSLEDFEKDERAAIREIFENRGLTDILDNTDQKIFEENKKEDEQRRVEYLRFTFGTTIDEKSYAESLLNEKGEYFAKPIISEKKSELLGVFIGVGITFVLVPILLWLLNVPGSISFLGVGAAIGIVFFGFGYARSKERFNKSSVILKKQGEFPVINVKHENERINFSYPFDYHCYQNLPLKSIEGIPLKQPQLYILLRNSDEFNRDILLQEDQTRVDRIFPKWDIITGELKYDLGFRRLSDVPLELEKLKRILDGLSPEKAVVNN